MPLFSVKMLLKNLLAQQGYEMSLHRISKKPYKGPKIAFIHIAKSGGNSIDYALRSVLSAPNQRRISKQTTLVSSMTSFNQIIDSEYASHLFSEHHAHHLQKITEYYLKLQWQYVSGHITINSALLKDFQCEYAFITVLRDPVKRFVSNYVYNKLTNSMNIMLPNNILTGGTTDNSIDNIIAEAKTILSNKRGWQMANAPTMYLTGRYPKNKDDAKEMQSEVAENLDKFNVVGFLDNLHQFEQKMEKLTGEKIAIAKRNTINKHKTPENNEIKNALQNFFSEPDIIKQLNQLCQIEIENYQKIKTLHN